MWLSQEPLRSKWGGCWGRYHALFECKEAATWKKFESFFLIVVLVFLLFPLSGDVEGPFVTCTKARAFLFFGEEIPRARAPMKIDVETIYTDTRPFSSQPGRQLRPRRCCNLKRQQPRDCNLGFFGHVRSQCYQHLPVHVWLEFKLNHHFKCCVARYELDNKDNWPNLRKWTFQLQLETLHFVVSAVGGATSSSAGGFASATTGLPFQ